MSLISDITGGILVAAAVMLFVGGASKVFDREEFASQIRTYAVVPDWTATVLGETLPFAEVVVAGLVLADPRLGGLLVAALFGAFAGGMSVNLARGRRELVCGCFGPRGRRTISWPHAVTNLIFAGAGVDAGLGQVALTLPIAIVGICVLLTALVVESVADATTPRSPAANEKR
jgi:hypothetical protein